MNVLDAIDWNSRISRQVRRWWRRHGYRYADISLRDDLTQAGWLAVLEGKIREDHWASDLMNAIVNAASLQVRGTSRGKRRAPWCWSAQEIHASLRDRRLPLDEQVHLRRAIRTMWQGLNARAKLMCYGLCCVPNVGPGVHGIPDAWSQQWGFSNEMLRTGRRAMRRGLTQALNG